MAKAEIVVNRVDNTADAADDAEMLSLVQMALKRSGVKQEAAAALAGKKASQVSGALNGHGAFDIRWLAKFPREFWDEYLLLLRASKEQSDVAVRMRRRERLILAIELLLSEVA